MKHIKKLIWALTFLVFVLTSISYINCGDGILEGAYNAFSLFFVNKISDRSTVMIEAAKWLSPLLLLGGLSLFINDVYRKSVKYLVSLKKESVAIYGDGEIAKILHENIKDSILDSGEIVKYAKKHIIAFQNDNDSLAFYTDHMDEIDPDNVYVKLEEIDLGIMKETKAHYFSMYDMVSRLYWRNNNLIEYFYGPDKKDEVHIAIVGFDLIGQNILKSAYLNNLYKKQQKIVYHIWIDDDNTMFQDVHNNMITMNDDEIIWESGRIDNNVYKLKSMDRIIITRDRDHKLIKSCIFMCTDTEIHIYDEIGDILIDVLKYDRLKTFGSAKEILTADNVIREDLQRLSKRLNFTYHKKYVDAGALYSDELADKLFMELDGFTKGSNNASCDYHRIRLLILKACGKDENLSDSEMAELAEIEHIRWSRYHYYNGWVYGIPENQKAKDAKKRIHSCLVEFSELSDENVDKDKELITLLLNENII